MTAASHQGVLGLILSPPPPHVALLCVYILCSCIISSDPCDISRSKVCCASVSFLVAFCFESAPRHPWSAADGPQYIPDGWEAVEVN